MLLESHGLWPGAIMTILMAQIPKSGGGMRPIGLLSGFVRLWEKARQPVIDQWRLRVRRSYNWAAKGRSPHAAVWRQALIAEEAAAKGQASAATLVDLVKAFEMVRLELIWARGIELGFPALILRMVLETFAFARRLLLHGAVSEAVDSLSAILAGGGFATDAMFLVLIKPCDTMMKQIDSIDLCLFIDDLTIHVVGSESSVSRDMAMIVAQSVELLEVEMKLTISRVKTVAIASTRKLAARLKPAMRRRGIAVRSKAKLLGVDFSCGKRACRSSQRSRVKSICARLDRYKSLRKKAAAHLVRTGAAPGMLYGANVYGTPSTTIKAVRGYSCAVKGELRGRPTFARLQLAGYDAGKELAIGPIIEWAKACWDGLASRETLQVTWQRAVCGRN